MTKKIPLSGKYGKGKFALVDDEDFERVSQHRWHCRPCANTEYALSSIRQPQTHKFVKVHLHRFILDAQSGQIVDHINGNGLDDRRSNLRFVSSAQNNMNRRPQRNASSPYKGVAISSDGNRWCAFIGVDRQLLHLGSFETQKEAAIAYNEAAKQHFGKFARLNVLRSDVPDKPLPSRKTSSTYVGVNWNKTCSKWVARVAHEKQQYWVGRFDSEIEAARARDEFIKLHGFPNSLNFP